jgi:Domain of unknown function (DUF1707)
MSAPTSRNWGRWVNGLGDQVSGQASMRLSDDEREAASRELGEHFATGRLSATEHHERNELVWTAKTRGELAPLFRDLPTLADRSGAQFIRPGHPRYSRGPAPRRGGLPPVFVVLFAVIGVLLLSVTWPIFLVVALAWWVVSGHTRHRWAQRRFDQHGFGPRRRDWSYPAGR